jgi:hypothetical protein
MTAIYRASLDYAVPTVTTLAGAQAAIEGIAALQRQQQVVVIALHRRFMSLGGSRGLGGTFPPQVAHLALFKVGTSRRSVEMFRHEPAGAGVDFLTIQELINHCDSKPALSLPKQSIV